MKILAALSLALALLVGVSAAQAQENPVAGPLGATAGSPATALRGIVPAPAGSVPAATPRKVRVVLQSPYGN